MSRSRSQGGMGGSKNDDWDEWGDEGKVCIVQGIDSTTAHVSVVNLEPLKAQQPQASI